MNDISAHDIEALVRIFDDSSWDELHLKLDGIEIHLCKNPDGQLRATTIGTAQNDEPAPDAAAAIPAPALAETAAAITSPAKAAAPGIPDGMFVVRAPNLGTFYRSPKPGASPYVVIGQNVEPDTEVCLIEVMKLFTPVYAGTAGTIRQILAEDAQLVEFDQALFLIEPLT